MSLYLNHAATALPRAPAAAEAMVQALTLPSPGRGQDAAAELIQRARLAVAARVGGGLTCFTSGATASLNMAISGVLTAKVRRRVLHDPLLHNASYRPLCAHGAELVRMPHDAHGRVDVETLRKRWPECELVVVTHVSNVSGTEQPLKEIAALAAAHGVPVVVDASQSAGVLSAQSFAGDFIAFSAHKGFRGPPGIGALVVRDGAPLLTPLLTGGTGSEAASAAMPNELPWRLEAGTPNTPGIAAFGAAAALPPWPTVGREVIADLRTELAGAGAVLIGASDTAIVSFNLASLDARDVARILLSSFGIAVRAGLHCAPMAHETLGTFPVGSVRVSWNTEVVEADLISLCSAVRALTKGNHGS